MSSGEVETWLWKKAQTATKRYFKGWHRPKSVIDKSMRTMEQCMYNTGWIMGYRAGAKSRK